MNARIYESDLDYRDDPVVVLENDILLAAFDVTRGGRCMTLLDKRCAIDSVANNRWQETGIGLLDDFNGNGLYPAPFRLALVEHQCRQVPGGVELVMTTIERRYKTVPLDVRLTKRVKLRNRSTRLEVTYELSNRTRRKLALDLNICNFVQPWGEEMEIAYPTPDGVQTKKAGGGWMLFREENLSGGWCAAFGPISGRGIRIDADFRQVKAYSAYARGSGFSIDLDTFIRCVSPNRSLTLRFSVEALQGCHDQADVVPERSTRKVLNRREASSMQIAQALPAAGRFLKKIRSLKAPGHPRLLFNSQEQHELRRPRDHAIPQALRDHALNVADRILTLDMPSHTPSQCSLLHLAYAWLLTGEKRFLHAAKSGLLNQAERPADGPMPRAILYDWLHSDLTAGQRQKIRETDLPGLRDAYRTYVSAAGHHPRGLMGTGMKRHCPNPISWMEVVPFGLAGLAYLGEIPDAPAWIELARRTAIGFLEYFEEEVGKDGEYFEGSTYYYAFMPSFVTFLEALRRTTGEDLFNYNGWLRKNLDWITFCSLSGKQMIPFGDSSGRGGCLGVHQATFLYLMARRFQHGGAQFAADQQAEASLEWWKEDRDSSEKNQAEPKADFAIWADLWRDPGLVPQKPSGKLTHHYQGCGWGVMRQGFDDDDLVVAIQGWKTVGHCHGMQGHYVVAAKGEFIMTDPGYILHSPLHSARWHSLLVVDGQEQFDWDAEHFQVSPAGCLRLVDSTSHHDHFVADLTMNYRGLLQLYQRHFFYLRPHTIVVIDDAHSAEERRFESYVQCAGPPRRVRGGYRFDAAGRRAFMNFFASDSWGWQVNECMDSAWPQYALALSLKMPARQFLSALVIQIPDGQKPAPVTGVIKGDELSLSLQRGKTEERIHFHSFGSDKRKELPGDGVEIQCRPMRPGRV